MGFPWGTRVRVHPPTGLRGGGVVLVGCIIWSKVLVSEAAGPLGGGGGEQLCFAETDKTSEFIKSKTQACGDPS